MDWDAVDDDLDNERNWDNVDDDDLLGAHSNAHLDLDLGSTASQQHDILALDDYDSHAHSNPKPAGHAFKTGDDALWDTSSEEEAGEMKITVVSPNGGKNTKNTANLVKNFAGDNDFGSDEESAGKPQSEALARPKDEFDFSTSLQDDEFDFDDF